MGLDGKVHGAPPDGALSGQTAYMTQPGVYFTILDKAYYPWVSFEWKVEADITVKMRAYVIAIEKE